MYSIYLMRVGLSGLNLARVRTGLMAPLASDTPREGTFPAYNNNDAIKRR
jgi:hypothetical protein